MARSIPACAGEPGKEEGYDALRRVYPRVCGGTPWEINDHQRAMGLSPRVRGNLRWVGCGGRRPGSIPACAGEPGSSMTCIRRGKVYPRVCGGTPEATNREPPWEGLSPRVRGNPSSTSSATGKPRSIPACAGEPPGRLTITSEQGVYPRVCGGTGAVRRRNYPFFGLSPRVRGNHPVKLLSPPCPRSIPACAGEPYRSFPRTNFRTVYPRVCGGTWRRNGRAAFGRGLSPRVRGNPPVMLTNPPCPRSIPACAGEPRLTQWPATW